MKKASLYYPRQALLVQAREKDVRQSSTSGGVFRLVAESLLAQGGVVVGAAFDEDGVVRHRLVRDVNSLKPLLKSKYVQSDFACVLPDMECALSSGLRVLFSGTPCQVAAVRAKFDEKYPDTLFCIDLLCHGTPPMDVFQSWVKAVESRENVKVVAYDFRDKSKGWSPIRSRIAFSNGVVLLEEMNDYLFAFLYNLILKESCGKCPWARPERTGDLTLGDAWGMMRDWLDKKDNTGLSLVLVNTSKGAHLLDLISDKVLSRKVKFIKACKKQEPLGAPPKLPHAASVFRKEFAATKDFPAAFSAAFVAFQTESQSELATLKERYHTLLYKGNALCRLWNKLSNRRKLRKLANRIKELNFIIGYK